MNWHLPIPSLRFRAVVEGYWCLKRAAQKLIVEEIVLICYDTGILLRFIQVVYSISLNLHVRHEKQFIYHLNTIIIKELFLSAAELLWIARCYIFVLFHYVLFSYHEGVYIIGIAMRIIVCQRKQHSVYYIHVPQSIDSWIVSHVSYNIYQ